MPVFTFPLAFIALLAVPALVAIYWLRNQSRERHVSSLLLWLDERQMWEGGRRIQRLQTPLLFFLEQPYEEYEFFPAGHSGEASPMAAPGRIGKRLTWAQIRAADWPSIARSGYLSLEAIEA